MVVLPHGRADVRKSVNIFMALIWMPDICIRHPFLSYGAIKSRIALHGCGFDC